VKLLVDNGADVDIQNVGYLDERENNNTRFYLLSKCLLFCKKKKMYRGSQGLYIVFLRKILKFYSTSLQPNGVFKDK